MVSGLYHLRTTEQLEFGTHTHSNVYIYYGTLLFLHQLRLTRGHTAKITVSKFLNSSKYFVSASTDNTVRLWNVITGKQEWIHFTEGGTVGMVITQNDDVIVGDMVGGVSIIQFNNLLQ